jgi:hypothetical protein
VSRLALNSAVVAYLAFHSTTSVNLGLAVQPNEKSIHSHHSYLFNVPVVSLNIIEPFLGLTIASRAVSVIESGIHILPLYTTLVSVIVVIAPLKVTTVDIV